MQKQRSRARAAAAAALSAKQRDEAEQERGSGESYGVEGQRGQDEYGMLDNEEGASPYESNEQQA